MDWTRKDWIDLALMFSGACVGVAAFKFGAAPALGLEAFSGSPIHYAIDALAGTLCGYALRFASLRILSFRAA